jgi:hypothetical protein
VVKRRTLDDALSTDELAFYAAGEKSRQSPATPPTADQAPVPEEFLQVYPPETHTPSMSKRSAPTTFVSLNTRVSPATKRALKKAAIERELDFIEPFSLQDIVDQAVADWLRKEGYLK